MKDQNQVKGFLSLQEAAGSQCVPELEKLFEDGEGREKEDERKQNS